jgi:uncharacterized protein YbjQ (UPF0145 family)
MDPGYTAMDFLQLQLVNILIGLLFVLFFVMLGWLAGSNAERRHFKNLSKREAACEDMALTNLKSFPHGTDPEVHAMIITAEVVIASDYLKNLLAKIRKFFGGELRAYHSLMNRARREAILRMLEQARSHGYNAVCNIRVNLVDISGASSGGQMGIVVVMISGTAYRIPSEGV